MDDIPLIDSVARRAKAPLFLRLSPTLVIIPTFLVILLFLPWLIKQDNILYGFIASEPSMVQIIIHIIAAILSFCWTWSAFITYNLMLRSKLSALSMKDLRLHIAISKHTYDFSLPLPVMAVTILVWLIALLPAFLWTGALTPNPASYSIAYDVIIPDLEWAAKHQDVAYVGHAVQGSSTSYSAVLDETSSSSSSGASSIIATSTTLQVITLTDHTIATSLVTSTTVKALSTLYTITVTHNTTPTSLAVPAKTATSAPTENAGHGASLASLMSSSEAVVTGSPDSIGSPAISTSDLIGSPFSGPASASSPDISTYDSVDSLFSIPTPKNDYASSATAPPVASTEDAPASISLAPPSTEYTSPTSILAVSTDALVSSINIPTSALNIESSIVISIASTIDETSLSSIDVLSSSSLALISTNEIPITSSIDTLSTSSAALISTSGNAITSSIDILSSNTLAQTSTSEIAITTSIDTLTSSNLALPSTSEIPITSSSIQSTTTAVASTSDMVTSSIVATTTHIDTTVTPTLIAAPSTVDHKSDAVQGHDTPTKTQGPPTSLVDSYALPSGQVPPNGKRADTGQHSYSCTQACQANGTFTFCPGVYNADRITQSMAEANPNNETTRNHTKWDNSGYTYTGRSYGAGAAVGLFGDYDYSYSEVSMITKASCYYDNSTTWSINNESNSFQVGQHKVSAFLARDVSNGQQQYPIMTNGKDTSMLVAFASTTHSLAIAAGSYYNILNATRCDLDIVPQTVNVVVHRDGRRIKVTPLAPAGSHPELQALGAIALQQMTQLGTSLAASSIGEALLGNIRRTLGTGIDIRTQNSDAMSAIESSIEAAMDDIFVAINAYALTQNAVLKQTFTSELPAYQLGKLQYHIPLLAANFLALAAVVFVMSWTRLFAKSPAFDFADHGALLGAAHNGGGGNILDWDGDVRHPALCNSQWVFDTKLGSGLPKIMSHDEEVVEPIVYK